MKEQNYTLTVTVDKSPEEAFQAIKNIRGWWSEEIEGPTDKVGDVFDYHFRDLHRCTMKMTEAKPGKKVANDRSELIGLTPVVLKPNSVISISHPTICSSRTNSTQYQYSDRAARPLNPMYF